MGEGQREKNNLDDSAVLVGAVPGALLLGTGLSGLLWAVESRTFQFMALGSVLGVILCLPEILLSGPVTALVLGLGSAVSFLAVGYLALGQHRCPAPAVDPSHLFWANAPAIATHSLSAEGIREETIRALLRPVSPLALEPMVPHARRAIFAGVVDRVVPSVQAHSLWRHWDEPRIDWYQGAHQRFIRFSEGREVLEETLRAADMLPRETTGTASQR